MLKGKKVKAVQILLLKLRLRINNTYLCVLSMFFLDSSLLESMTWITKFSPPHFLSFEQICEHMSQHLLGPPAVICVF